jgi:hypothetical protein
LHQQAGSRGAHRQRRQAGVASINRIENRVEHCRHVFGLRHPFDAEEVRKVLVPRLEQIHARIRRRHSGRADKLLRIETEGCAVHIVIGLHDPDGRRFTSVEVEQLQPVNDGDVWHVRGPSTMLLLNHGPQLLAGDSANANTMSPSVSESTG